MKADAPGALLKTVTLALAGNPNCGKTTLFNALTGGDQKIGNWPGVTVERKEGYTGDRLLPIRVVDLPGIYSFYSSSEDERIAQDYLLSGEADLVVNIVDASHLERNLFLTTQLIEMEVPVVVVLNMMDLAEKQGASIDTGALQEMLGVPVFPLTAVEKSMTEGFKKELKEIFSRTPGVSYAEIRYPAVLEDWIARLKADGSLQDRRGKRLNRWQALKIIEEPESAEDILGPAPEALNGKIEDLRQRLFQAEGEEADVVIANSRFDYIHTLVSRVARKGAGKVSPSEKVDKIVLNRFLGIPIFLGIMYLAFWLAISVGSAFIDFFDILFGTVFVDGFGTLLTTVGSPDWLTAILANGVGTGLQTVATFIPVVFFMFLVLSLLEDSGYMARAAFVMDRLMRSIGLPGKAFIPMIVGFGCTVPAILATRTLENKRDRFLTIFITPMMSCGARLPVYALFGAAFFGSWSGGVVFSLYLVGILFAVGTGLLLKHTLFQGEESPFVMELPEYHAPRFSSIMTYTWLRLKVFIRRAGKAIVLVVLIVAFLNSLGIDGSFGNEDTGNSVLSRIGMAITPVFTPMGIEKDNWPASVGLFTGLFAKEVTVGTLNALYAGNQEAAEEDEPFSFGEGIKESLVALWEGVSGMFDGFGNLLGTDIVGQDEEATAKGLEADVSIFSRMRDSFNPAGAYAYLLFVLLYFPCIAAFGAAIQEMGWKYGVIQAVYLTVLAWCAATLFYQIAEGGRVFFILLPLVVFTAMALFFRLMGRKQV